MEVLRQKFAKNKYHRHHISGLKRRNLTRRISTENQENSPEHNQSVRQDLRSKLRSRNTVTTDFSMPRTQTREKQDEPPEIEG